MEILIKCFDNNSSFYADIISNEMVEISWRDEYKRINNKEERIENNYNKANLYVDSA